MPPTFDTDRLILRPRTMADLDASIAMDLEPDVTRYVPGPWTDPAAHERFVRARIMTDYGMGLGYWSIFRKCEPSRFIGWILLIPADAVGPEIEIGWRLVRAAWGEGIATEAATPIVRHAFETVGLSKIVAEIDPDNIGSRRVAEKIGMAPGNISEHDGWRFLLHTLTRERYRSLMVAGS